MNKHRTTQTIGILICIIAILFSMIYLAPKMGAPQTYEKTIMSLDKKSKGVVELSALTVGVSSAITALPGDTGTTVADHLMDLNSGLFIVMIALFLEKYLLTIIGEIVFYFIIPLAFIILAIGFLKNIPSLRLKFINIFLTGILLVTAVPTGIHIADQIEDIYNFSLENTIQEAKNIKEETEDATNDATEEDSNFITGAISKVTDAISNAVTGIVDKGETFLNTVTQSLAILIVTSCVIPLLIVFLFLKLIKYTIGLDLTGSVLSFHKTLSQKQKDTYKKLNKKEE